MARILAERREAAIAQLAVGMTDKKVSENTDGSCEGAKVSLNPDA
ncbi:hypothetical protein [Qipengyuania flava]|nr:hypothetical protein [Qipengyuania flava]